MKQYFVNTNCETTFPRQHIFMFELFCLMMNNFKLENIPFSPAKSIAKLYAFIMLKFFWENWPKSIMHFCNFIEPKSGPCHLPMSIVSKSFTDWCLWDLTDKTLADGVLMLVNHQCCSSPIAMIVKILRPKFGQFWSTWNMT